MVLMAMAYESASDDYNKGLEICNLVFTGIFILEATLKITAFGKTYFYDNWNVFDFLVVIASLIDIILLYSNLTSGLTFLRVGPQLARVLRVLRVSRVLRLVNKYKGMETLISVIQIAIPSLLNVFSLLMLVFFMYSILGAFIFYKIETGAIIDDYTNFHNFGMALLTLFRISTGEDWHTIMYDCGRTTDCVEGETCGTSKYIYIYIYIEYAPIYFLSFTVITAYVMFNLFILIILDMFDQCALTKNNLLNNYKTDIIIYQNTWSTFPTQNNGENIHLRYLMDFLKEIDAPFGIKDFNQNQCWKHVINMDIIR